MVLSKTHRLRDSGIHGRGRQYFGPCSAVLRATLCGTPDRALRYYGLSPVEQRVMNLCPMPSPSHWDGEVRRQVWFSAERVAILCGMARSSRILLPYLQFIRFKRHGTRILSLGLLRG